MIIKLNDGNVYHTETTPGDLVAFERQYGLSAFEPIDRLEHVLFVAWHGISKTTDVGSFDEFLGKVVSTENDPGPLDQAK